MTGELRGWRMLPSVLRIGLGLLLACEAVFALGLRSFMPSSFGADLFAGGKLATDVMTGVGWLALAHRLPAGTRGALRVAAVLWIATRVALLAMIFALRIDVELLRSDVVWLGVRWGVAVASALPLLALAVAIRPYAPGLTVACAIAGVFALPVIGVSLAGRWFPFAVSLLLACVSVRLARAPWRIDTPVGAPVHVGLDRVARAARLLVLVHVALAIQIAIGVLGETTFAVVTYGGAVVAVAGSIWLLTGLLGLARDHVEGLPCGRIALAIAGILTLLGLELSRLAQGTTFLARDVDGLPLLLGATLLTTHALWRFAQHHGFVALEVQTRRATNVLLAALVIAGAVVVALFFAPAMPPPDSLVTVVLVCTAVALAAMRRSCVAVSRAVGKLPAARVISSAT